MSNNNDNQTPLNAPATAAVPAAYSGQAADSKTSGKVPVGKAEAQPPSPAPAREPTQGEAPVPAPAVEHPVKQDVNSLKQAAQLEHKPSSDGVPNPGGSNDCALAGGPSPQSPVSIATANSDKKDNHVSVRFTDAEQAVIEDRMQRTGEKQSDAVRGIVNDYAQKDGNVYLAPKSPPEQLEDFLGELRKWRSEFVKAQPRLNIPTPKSDDPRHKQVTEWRAESKRLLEEIKKVETVLKAALGAVTSLTPRKVKFIQYAIPFLRKNFEAANTKAATNPSHKDAADLWLGLLELIEDMGIKPEP